jgi:integrase
MEPVTKRNYQMILRRYLLPVFGATALDALTPGDVRTQFRRWEAEGKSGALMAKIRTVGSAMFADAIEDELADRNPFRGQKITPTPTKIMQILTKEQYDALLEAVPGHYKLLIRTLGDSGIRWGEAMALQPEDIIGDIIHVRRSRDDESGTTKPYTKSGGVRAVMVSKDLADDLRAGLPFTGSRKGLPIRATNWRREVWAPALKRAGISGVTPHDLRHSHASWLLNGGADLQVVKDRLGHSNISVTSRYLHTLPTAGDQALAALAAFRMAS